MRLLSCEYEGHARWGLLDGDHVLLSPADSELPATLLDAIESGLTPAELAAALRGHSRTQRVSLDAVSLTAPIPRPRKNIICLGLNYAAHAAESRRAKGIVAATPEHPVVFSKNVTAVTGPYSDIPLDAAVTEQFDWEAELAVVIGRGGRHIKPEEALEHVFGYTVVNDLTARDLQSRHQQFFLGKSLDHSCPMGPWIVTRDEIPDPQRLAIHCRVNGVTKQSGNTRDQLFDIARTISILSHSMRLEAGDIIATGTPEGVGFARVPPEFLKPGDIVECEIEAIGTIRNRIVEA